MSYPIASVDVSSSINGTIQTNGATKGEQIVLQNHSANCFSLTFVDGTQDLLPPNWMKSWNIDSLPMAKITYAFLFSQPSSGQMANIITGTLYEPGEHIQDVNTSLGYGNVGVAVASSIVNTGNPAGTDIIQASASGGGNITITNDGSIKIEDTSTATIIAQILSTNPGALILANDFGDVQKYMAPTRSIITGSGGTVRFSAPIWGDALKVLITTFVGYTNGSSASFSFPTSLIGGIILAFGIGVETFTLTGGTMQVITALGNATTAGSEANAANFHGNNIGYVFGTVTGISIGTIASAINGTILIIGA